MIYHTKDSKYLYSFIDFISFFLIYINIYIYILLSINTSRSLNINKNNSLLLLLFHDDVILFYFIHLNNIYIYITYTYHPSTYQTKAFKSKQHTPSSSLIILSLYIIYNIYISQHINFMCINIIIFI